MIIGRNFEFLDDKAGTIKMHTTYDMSAAAEVAREVNETGGRDKGKHTLCLGYIPPEEWQYDLTLIRAKMYQQEGDKGKFLQHVQKYFRDHPQFAVHHNKTYY